VYVYSSYIVLGKCDWDVLSCKSLRCVSYNQINSSC